MANGSSTAAASTAIPAYCAQSPKRFTLALPPARLERLEPDEERQEGEVHVVHDVLRVEDALGEGVVVLDDRQLAEQRLPHPARGLGAPPDHPEHEEDDERRGARHDLVLEERRDADRSEERRVGKEC